MNLEILIPVVVMTIGLFTAFVIGFGIGRRSAYHDISANLGTPKSEEFSKAAVWRSKAKSILTAHTVK